MIYNKLLFGALLISLSFNLNAGLSQKTVARMPNLVVLNAAQSFHDAYERAGEGGFLTIAIVQGLSGKTKEMKVTLDTLLQETVYNVSRISQGHQLANIQKLSINPNRLICGINNTYIISIGTNRFIDAEIPTLSSAEIDTRNISSAFDTACYSDNTIISGKDVNRKNILYSLNNVINKAKQHDNIIIFFSGHGLKVSGEERLVMHNSQYSTGKISRISSSSVSVDYLKQSLLKSKANTLLILDTSFNHLSRHWE